MTALLQRGAMVDVVDGGYPNLVTQLCDATPEVVRLRAQVHQVDGTDVGRVVGQQGDGPRAPRSRPDNIMLLLYAVAYRFTCCIPHLRGA